MDKIFLISRSIYNIVEAGKGMGKLSEDRCKLTQRYFIDSLKNQTDPDFKLFMFVGDEGNKTSRLIKGLHWGELDVEFLHIPGGIPTRNFPPARRRWTPEDYDRSPEGLIRKHGHPMSSIMMRMDSDDWFAPGLIAHIKYTINQIEDPNFIINYQLSVQGNNGLLYRFHARHSRRRTSAYIVLVQRQGERMSPYATNHTKMGRRFPAVYNVPPGYVFVVLHKENRVNKLRKDILLEAVLDKG